MTLTEKILYEFHEQQFGLPDIEAIKKEYQVVETLGSGSYGIAYLTSAGHVLKITTNSLEVKVATALLKKKYPHLVDIFWVGNPIKTSRGNTCWLILQEKLRWLDRIEQSYFDTAQWFYEDYIAKTAAWFKKYNTTNTAEIIKAIMNDDFDKKLSEDFKSFNDMEGFIKFFNKYATAAASITKLKFADFHKYNCGWKENGNMAAFDLIKL